MARLTEKEQTSFLAQPQIAHLVTMRPRADRTLRRLVPLEE
ncbi:MAG: hypothetical protein CM1200mP27_11090 [Chloroflexota bacterium]|nr:MAG: hypothetical protein CM1200mP27_11090 [Chloroflexota bacterium]